MLRIDINLLFTIVNLLVLYFLMKKFLFKPVREVLAKRQGEIDETYKKAEEANKAAADLKKQYEDSLAGIEAERQKRLDASNIEASKEYDEIVNNANKKADKIIQDAKLQAEKDAEAKQHEMQQQMAVLVAQAAYKIAASKDSSENDEKLTEAQKIALYAKYGLDQPFFIRFLKYLQNMLHGDLGVSDVINKNRNVTDLLGNPLLVSIRIGAQAMVIGSILGLLLGIAAALHHNSWIDSLCSIVSILGVSIPSYVFALLLAYYIGFKLKWAPILYNSNNPVNSSVLPTIALAMFPMANISRFARSEMIDVLSSDYISLVEAKGVRERPLIMHHALRNTMIPLVTIMGPLLVNLLTGSMVVEKVFAIPGIGMLMVQAIQSNDYNVVIACAFVYSAMYIIMMLIVDILYGVIDPRIRVAKGEK